MRHTFAILFSLILAIAAQGAPMELKELAFLIRVREPDTYIISQIVARKLSTPISDTQRDSLRALGASSALIRIISQPGSVITAEEAEALAKEKEQRAVQNQIAAAAPLPRARDSYRSFTQPYGQPLQMANWGGGSEEIRFFPRGLGVVYTLGRPTFIDPFAQASNQRSKMNWDDVSGSYSPNQVFDVQRTKPVYVDGVGTLYSVRETSRASLYFISSTSDGVNLAVRSAAAE